MGVMGTPGQPGSPGPAGTPGLPGEKGRRVDNPQTVLCLYFSSVLGNSYIAIDCISRSR
jgi:hypothetical protein